jgi:thiamine biosynthesis protein ThiS
MKIQLNGKTHAIEAAMTVSALLECVGFGGKPVVVELNEQAVFPRDFPSVWVADGARVEIVTLAAGG